MSRVTADRRPVNQSNHPQSNHLKSNHPRSNHALLAWAGVVLTPVGVALALGLCVLIGQLVGLLDWGEPSGTRETAIPWYTGEDALKVAFVIIPAWLVSMLAPAFGLWQGERASRSGSRPGKAAAMVAGVLLALIAGYGLTGLVQF